MRIWKVRLRNTPCSGAGESGTTVLPVPVRPALQYPVGGNAASLYPLEKEGNSPQLRSY